MRRLVSWVLLLALSSAAVWDGRLGFALVAGAAKALLVGAEFMELRHAARAHAVAFAGFVAALAAGLWLVAR